MARPSKPPLILDPAATVTAPPLAASYNAATPGSDTETVDFLPETRSAWAALWRAPIAQTWDDSHHETLFAWAVWTDRFRRGSLTTASRELRRLEADLLITAKAQRAAGVEYAEPEPPPDHPGTTPRRKRVRAVGP